MAEINLLPWREEKRERETKQFHSWLMLSCSVAVLIVLVMNFFANRQMDGQNRRNTLLREEIKLLDAKIREIKKLKKIRQALISRMDIIQNLQETRPLTVHMSDEVVKIIPNSVHLITLERQGHLVILKGLAQSHSAISRLMRNVKNSQWLHNPVLIEIKTSKAKQREFTLTFSLKPKRKFQFSL